MGYNLSLFWQDALAQITSNSNFQGNVKPGANQILFVQFSSAEGDVYSPSDFAAHGLPNAGFLSNYQFTNYQNTGNKPLPDATLSLENLLNYNAVILVSFSRALDPSALAQYLKKGGGVMAFPIGFGRPCLDSTSGSYGSAGGDPATTVAYNTANYECLNMNTFLAAAQFPYQYDCGNTSGNLESLATSPTFSNITNPSQTLPFSNGYAVIPTGGVQTTANFCH